MPDEPTPQTPESARSGRIVLGAMVILGAAFSYDWAGQLYLTALCGAAIGLLMVISGVMGAGNQEGGGDGS